MTELLTLCDQLIQELLVEAKQTKRQVYAIVDSAVHKNIHLLIRKTIARADYSNLFQHTDLDGIEEAAPYLIKLTASSRKLLNRIWKLPWGIFLTTQVKHEEIEEHLRRNLMAEAPLGEELLFRYYDPRVLPMFLECCSSKERRCFFGPIAEIHLFNDQEGHLERYRGQK